MTDTERISGGATAGTPTCPSCPHLLTDKGHPGWGWCDAPENRVMGKGWVNGFTPSQSPSGSCKLHPERNDGVKASDHQTPEQAWDNFVRHYAQKHGFIDKNGYNTMKNLIGGIDGFRQAFIEANKGD